MQQPMNGQNLVPKKMDIEDAEQEPSTKMVVALENKPDNLPALPPVLDTGAEFSNCFKKMKVVVKKDGIYNTVAREMAVLEKKASLGKSVKLDKFSRAPTPDETISKFFKLCDDELPALAKKKCINCGSLKVRSKGKTRKTGEPGSICSECNKEFPTRYALMMFEICNPHASQVHTDSEKPGIGMGEKSAAREAEPVTKGNAMSVEKATEILTSAPGKRKGNNAGGKEDSGHLNRNKLAFLYVKNLPRNRIGLIKKALLARIEGLGPGDIANIEYIGTSLAEIVVYDKVAKLLGDKLSELNISTSNWNPAGGEDGKARLRERMKRISARPGVQYKMKNLARNLSIAGDAKQDTLLRGCGVETGDSAILRRNTAENERKSSAKK